MRRAIDLAIKAVVAFVFVVCVECFCWRLRRKARSARPASLPPARLRMRTGIGRARATVAIEGTLDEFTARLLARRLLHQSNKPALAEGYANAAA